VTERAPRSVTLPPWSPGIGRLRSRGTGVSVTPFKDFSRYPQNLELGGGVRTLLIPHRNDRMKFIILIAVFIGIWAFIRRRGGGRVLDLVIALIPLALVYEIVGRFAGERWQWVVAVVLLGVAVFIVWRKQESRVERQWRGRRPPGAR